MAQFSQGFLSSLGRPEMSQSLFGLGAAIGGVPGQMKQRQKEQGFNQLMQQVQAAQGSGDFASMKALSQQMAQTNPQQAAQIMQAAIAGEEKQKRIQAGSGMFSGTPAEARASAEKFAAIGDFASAKQALTRAENLEQKGKQVGRARTSAQMLMSEIQGIMKTPDISEANKEKALGLLREAAVAGEDSDLLKPRVDELKQSLLPVKTGSKARPEYRTLFNEETGRNHDYAVSIGDDGEVIKKDLGPSKVEPEEDTEQGSVPASVERRMIAISEESTKAGTLLSRNRSLRDSLHAGTAKTTGVLSDLRTTALNFGGMRDKEEEDKTLYLKNRNTDIINSLPPGVASDKDIAIFSQGFPEANAGRQEILNYLAAEERILAAQQDMAVVFEQHLEKQIMEGRDASTVGYESKRQAYGNYMGKVLNAMEKEKDKNPGQAFEIEERYSKQMQQDLGFVPTFYR